MKTLLITIAVFLSVLTGYAQPKEDKPLPSYEQYVKKNVASKAELDVFLNELSWAQFDPEVGYRLGNYMPHDGWNNSSTISTSQTNGTRTSFIYPNRPCRINAYGNSFTQCHQVSDGETWEEYLAAHLGEPIRNFGMGGYGVYQTYRRMLREESTKDSAKYIIFYVWGDDHMRSLLRCRYMYFKEWFIKYMDENEGVGKMFHGNFWANVEMDLNTGKFVENKNRISTKKDLYKMTDPQWMWENLKTDFALQMALFSENKINDIDIPTLQKLSKVLSFPIDLNTPAALRDNVKKLLDKYAFAATKYIMDRAKEFAEKNGKKLMVVLFDPYNVTYPILKGNVTVETRYDKEIVEHLQQNGFNYFDMNLVHIADFKCFNLSVDDYYKRYFVGHYNPTGNHFFAYSIAPKIVEWLDPKPVTYQKTDKKLIDFKGYLNMKALDKK
jgi:hypothetical protein